MLRRNNSLLLSKLPIKTYLQFISILFKKNVFKALFTKRNKIAFLTYNLVNIDESFLNIYMSALQSSLITKKKGKF